MDRTDCVGLPLARLRPAGKVWMLFIIVVWNIIGGKMEGISRTDKRSLCVRVVPESGACAFAACSAANLSRVPE